MARLRSLLHQSEKEAEKSRDLLNTARIEAERLQGSDVGFVKSPEFEKSPEKLIGQ